jgi:hypothetical protein
MRIFSYVVEHDLGFAPNPFFGVCSLAACKPQIRRTAAVGDIVIGTGAALPNLAGHLIYWMKVEAINDFNGYWADPRYRAKRPDMFAPGKMLRYGDNIYHKEAGDTDYRQEDSFHSEMGGGLSMGNRARDTGTTDLVLLARQFDYFGEDAPRIPDQLSDFVKAGPGHKCRFAPDRIAAMLLWLQSLGGRGYRGRPSHWQFLKEGPA